MADPFVGEIRIFCGTFIPNDWAACDGATLQIQQNSVLYSVIGTQYGGNGSTTFMLPDLNGMTPIHQGTGVGLTPRALAEKGGASTVTLTQSTIPTHTHGAMALDAAGGVLSPSDAVWAQNVSGGRNPVPQPQYATDVNTVMNAALLAPAGGVLPHNNMQPYLPLQFMICLYGEYPSRP
ncbi:phage tail protein [Janthinobacterium sp. MDT1-19]|uniref:phage tail protein n=1 Tax=Janthinobacterium sp. MDT1-19 TaxID=1259339 RepID=UPI003F272DCA